MVFYFHANKTHFHKKGFALCLVLKVRVFGTRKWLIGDSSQSVFEAKGIVRNEEGDGIENGEKAIGLMGKTTTLHVHHAFLYISLRLLHDYNVKLASFKVMLHETICNDDF